MKKNRLAIWIAAALAVVAFQITKPAHADAAPGSDTPGTPALDIRFFPHLSPSIDQYIAGKAKFTEVLEHIRSQGGYVLQGLPTEVGVSRMIMNGGDIVHDGGKLYFYFGVEKSRLEGVLLQWFATVSSQYPMISYRPHLGATPEQVLTGRYAIEAVIRRFEENHLDLQLPQSLPIAIARTSMHGGNIVEEGGITYIYFMTPQEQIEGYFMKFCKSL